jgi:hypothetical protein
VDPRRSAVGIRGALVLAVAGIVGIVLAVNGWSARHVGLAAATGGLSASSAPSSPAAPAPSAAPTTGQPSPAPSASASHGASPSASAGPLLSSEPYASYAYLVWPGTPSATAQQAETGLKISVSRLKDGISVTAGVNGQPAPAAHTYVTGAKVYVVESSLGDDSGGSDYNLGDDGLVVTDARGRIVQ